MQFDNVVSEEALKQPSLRFWEIVASSAYLLSLLGAGLFSWSAPNGLGVFATLAVVGSAAWLLGSLIGFLFGVPRFQAGRDEREQSVDPQNYIPNTNLEQISDWLTKLIVGAALVQIKDIAAGLADLAEIVGAAINQPGSAAVAGGIIIFSLCAGFMWGYLWCSLRIFREMAASLRDRSGASSDRVN